MKIFAVITLCAMVVGSQAFIGEIKDLFHNIGVELGAVGKDLLHVATPVATSLLSTLEKAGTQLLTTAASDLLSHLGAGGAKRDMSELVGKVAQFVEQGKDFIKEKGLTLAAGFKATVAQVQSEIQQVLADAKPIGGLIEEVKSVLSGHNNFVDSLISKAKEEAMTLFHDVLQLTHSKRAVAEGAHSFGETLEQLLQQVAGPLKSALSGIVQSLESKVAGLLG